jgi:hypothetical protein
MAQIGSRTPHCWRRLDGRTGTKHLVRPVWASDQLVAEAATRVTNARDEHSWLLLDSNPRSQQASGRRRHTQETRGHGWTGSSYIEVWKCQTGLLATAGCRDRLDLLRLHFIYVLRTRSGLDLDFKKVYSFWLMVEASDHGYVLHTRRIHVTRYRIRYDKM